MSKNQFTGTATQRNRNATAHFVDLIRTSTVYIQKTQPPEKQQEKQTICIS